MSYMTLALCKLCFDSFVHCIDSHLVHITYGCALQYFHLVESGIGMLISHKFSSFKTYCLCRLFSVFLFFSQVIA